MQRVTHTKIAAGAHAYPRHKRRPGKQVWQARTRTFTVQPLSEQAAPQHTYWALRKGN